VALTVVAGLLDYFILRLAPGWTAVELAPLQPLSPASVPHVPHSTMDHRRRCIDPTTKQHGQHVLLRLKANGATEFTPEFTNA
jgi:hypothetical protein